MEMISWSDRVRIKEVWQRVKDKGISYIQ